MRCPFCNNQDTKVIDSRAQDENTVIRRRRVCEECTKRFTTYERVDLIPITIIKKDGSREIFDKNKLLGGIMKACNKRQVPMEKIENLVQDVEHTLIGKGEREIDSNMLGTLIMERLKDVDEIAYVRFASVYRQFKDIDDFKNELEKMTVEKES